MLNLHAVIYDTFVTGFMQHADMFEPFKVWMCPEISFITTKLSKNTFKRKLSWFVGCMNAKDKRYQIAALFHPADESIRYFKDGIKVVSDVRGWILLKDYVEQRFKETQEEYWSAIYDKSISSSAVG